jgi:hypothetical protein
MDSKKKKKIAGSFKTPTVKVDFRFDVVEYADKGLIVLYSPALDLFGYGKTAKKAQESFTLTLEEYLHYTIDKNTFLADLRQHGWIVKKKKQTVKVNSPSFDKIVSGNLQFQEIFNHKDFKKFNINREVAFPA